MDSMLQYMDTVAEIMHTVRTTQAEGMEKAAQRMADATLKGHNLFVFGCNHAGLIALELYYRTGGMVTINPVQAPGMGLDVRPPTLTSEMERMSDYGRIIIDAQPIAEGDVLLIHSVSGRNTVSIDAALRAKEKGAFVIALTNLATSKAVGSRHPSGKKLFEVADLVLDNCGCVGDASQMMSGVPQKVGPTSTVVGAYMVNAIMVQTVSNIVRAGGVAPVFISANLDEGDGHNKAVLDLYKTHIFYM